MLPLPPRPRAHGAVCGARRPARGTVEGRRVDAVNAPGVGLDPVVAVHERLEAHEVLTHREGHGAEFHEVMGRLPGGLAVQGDEMEPFDRRVRTRALRTPGLDCIVERGKWLGSRRTESR